MKLSTKSMSSPGRAEKYPPPLMRFLRSNVGSRSRGRSRSSPMFVRKRNTAIENQEPSSPKVTCMGQVRVKRSKQAGRKPGRPGNPSPPRRCSCKWIRNALFCHHFPETVKVKPYCSPWKKWGAFLNIGTCRKPKIREDTSKSENRIEDSVEENGEDEESEENEKEAKIFASSSCSSPPKNALLLTRCRSAPYRSLSLAYRFWASPLSNNEGIEDETEHENRGFKGEKPTSDEDFISRNSDQRNELDSESEEKSGFCKEFDDKKTENSENGEEPKTEQSDNVRPLILTRCKSEPARTGGRLDPELNFWKKRSLGFT